MAGATTTSTSSKSWSEGPVGSTPPPPAGSHSSDALPVRDGVVLLRTQNNPLPRSVLAQDASIYGAGC